MRAFFFKDLVNAYEEIYEYWLMWLKKNILYLTFFFFFFFFFFCCCCCCCWSFYPFSFFSCFSLTLLFIFPLNFFGKQIHTKLRWKIWFSILIFTIFLVFKWKPNKKLWNPTTNPLRNWPKTHYLYLFKRLLLFGFLNFDA